MNRSSYRGEHKGSTIKARSKIYASRTFRLVLAFVLAVGLMPGLSYASSVSLEPQPGEDAEQLDALSEQIAAPAEEQSGVNEDDRQQEDQQGGQQPEQQEGQQEGQLHQDQQLEQQQAGQQPDQQDGQTPGQQSEQQQEGQQPDQQDSRQPDQQDDQQRPDQKDSQQEGQQPDQQDSRQPDQQGGQLQGQKPEGEGQAPSEPALAAMNATAPTVSDFTLGGTPQSGADMTLTATVSVPAGRGTTYNVTFSSDYASSESGKSVLVPANTTITGSDSEQTATYTFTFPAGAKYAKAANGEGAKITVTPSSGGAAAVSKTYSEDVNTDTASTLGAAEVASNDVVITYDKTSTAKTIPIDGVNQSVKMFSAATTMTVAMSNGDFEVDKNKIVITNVSADDQAPISLSGADAWKQQGNSPTGKWAASYTINTDGRYKVEVFADGSVVKTDYIDVDLIGPQVDVVFHQMRAGVNKTDSTKVIDYFNAETKVTVTVTDRNLAENIDKPKVTSPSGKPDSFFGDWTKTTDSADNRVYQSLSSSFEENTVVGQTYKFGVTVKDTAGHQTVYAYGDNEKATGTTGAKSTTDRNGTALEGKSGGFVVDTTRPTVAVKFDKVVRHPTGGDNSTDYFTELTVGSGVVTATIVVTDKNFNKDDPNNTVNITKADGTDITTEGWFEDTSGGNQDYQKGQWTYKINFPESKPGEKFSFSFTATDWAGLTTEYRYGYNKAATSTAGATSTVDDADQANKLNGENFVVDGRHPNVNVTMGGARVQKASTGSIDAFNVNTVTIAVDDGSFNAAATDKPKFMVLSGSTETETEAGIEFGEWVSDAMTVKLPDSKKGESYKFTLTARDMIYGTTDYKYGENNDEETNAQYNVKIGRARSTKDSTGATMTGGSFIIDTTAPKLGVSFDTAAVNTTGEKTELTRYYNASASSVVAKVSVTDIHLDTKDVSVKVYESDGTTEASGYTVSSWAAGDTEDTQVATVTIDKPATDKTYIFKVTGQDQFENQIESADPGTYVEAAAGTEGAYYQSKIIFDTQAPKITVAWGDEATNGKYYNADREATITVDEANFDASRMQISQDGGNTWTTTAAGDWDGDGTYTYTGSLRDFTADGTYTLQVKGTDLVGNPLEAGAVPVDGMSTQSADPTGSLLVASADPVDDGQPADTQQGSINDGTYASAEFVIDKTAPTATITWDNSNARDGMYYNSPRTATITVTEHNFRADDFAVETDGEVSGWSDDGDAHTCTVSFASDGRYALSVSGQDLAGNEMEAMSEPEFVIDLTEPDTDPEEPTDDPAKPAIDPAEPDADPAEPDTDPAEPAVDHDDKADPDAKDATDTPTAQQASTSTAHQASTQASASTARQAGTLTARLGDSLFELSLPLVAGCLIALLIIIALSALRASRRKGHGADGEGVARG